MRLPVPLLLLAVASLACLSATSADVTALNVTHRKLSQGTCPRGGKCGSNGAGCTCPDGQCCSKHNFCGITTAHCGLGCQPSFGSCGTVPSPIIRSPSPTSPKPSPSPTTGCPAGWSIAVGTIYDSWPKPGTKECTEYSGCRWAGMFSNIDGGSKPNCVNGAKLLDGGNGVVDCRFPEAKVKSWSMAATNNDDRALLNRKLQVMVQGVSSKVVTVNVLDVCKDSDCGGCCSKNTANKQYKLIDIEKWPASALLGFSTSDPNFDVNDVKTPPAGALRPELPYTMALCYKDVGAAIKPV